MVYVERFEVNMSLLISIILDMVFCPRLAVGFWGGTILGAIILKNIEAEPGGSILAFTTFGISCLCGWIWDSRSGPDE